MIGRRMAIILAVVVLASAAAVGTGYALLISSTIDIDDNQADSAFLTVSINGDTGYSQNFTETVEYHLGTLVDSDVSTESEEGRDSVFSPCSWYLRIVNGVPVMKLGTVNLKIESSASVSKYLMNMDAVNPTSMTEEFGYMVMATIGGIQSFKEFNQYGGGVDFEIGVGGSDIELSDPTSENLTLDLYMVATTVQNVPPYVLKDTSFSFTVTADTEDQS
jgi:hypothetical protein